MRQEAVWIKDAGGDHFPRDSSRCSLVRAEQVVPVVVLDRRVRLGVAVTNLGCARVLVREAFVVLGAQLGAVLGRGDISGGAARFAGAPA